MAQQGKIIEIKVEIEKVSAIEHFDYQKMDAPLLRT